MANKKLLPYQVSLAGTLLRAREAVMAPIRPILRQANVTEQQWRVLRVLDDSGRVDVTSIAELALLHAPSVTRIVRELGERGLLIRTIDVCDARRSFVTITRAGHNLVVRTASKTGKLLEKYEERFGAERLNALRSELSELTKALGDGHSASDDADSEVQSPARKRSTPRRLPRAHHAIP